jgi:hypothetical protein
MPQSDTVVNLAKSGNEAPSRACWFSDQEGLVTFADETTDPKKGNRFSIVGYSGEIIPNHWYWGNLAFDLSGMKFAKKKTPVLCQHDVDRRVGVASKQDIADQVTFEGDFLSNQDAAKVRADMLEGFPMEASLYVPPSVIEFVEDGAEVEVNGRTLKGPGTVFRKSTIKEVSICVFGADAGTTASAFKSDSVVRFSRTESEATMPEKNELTMAILQKDHADLYAAVYKAGQADGESKERTLFGEILSAAGGDVEIAAACFKEGKSPADATKMRLDKVETENKRLRGEAAKAGEKPAKEHKVDPATQEFSDTEAAQRERNAKAQADSSVTVINPDDIKAVKAAWDASKDLQTEFHSPEILQGFLRSERARQERK